MKILVLIAIYLIADVTAYRGYHYKRWKPRKPICDPVKCEKDCEEELTEAGCPKCVCKLKCPILDCDKECEMKGLVFKDILDEGPCSKCECEIKAELKKDEKEFKGKGGLGLDERSFNRKIPDFKKDIEDVKCSPPKCPPGCFIEEEYDGPCPGCKCEDKKFPGVDERSFNKKIPDFKKGIEDVKCSPPKCPPGCFIEEEYDGPCPGCKCEDKKFPKKKVFDIEEEFEDKKKVFEPRVACSPPKCPPGCEIEKEFDGPCPGCKCFEKDLKPDISEGRQFKKKLECTPPKCPPGCEIEKFFDGPCPGCKCDKDYGGFPEEEKKKDCIPVKLCPKPNCEIDFDEKGCEICKCKPICDPPKCPRRCTIDTSGECPKCVCKKYKWFG